MGCATGAGALCADAVRGAGIGLDGRTRSAAVREAGAGAATAGAVWLACTGAGATSGMVSTAASGATLSGATAAGVVTGETAGTAGSRFIHQNSAPAATTSAPAATAHLPHAGEDLATVLAPVLASAGAAAETGASCRGRRGATTGSNSDITTMSSSICGGTLSAVSTGAVSGTAAGATAGLAAGTREPPSMPACGTGRAAGAGVGAGVAGRCGTLEKPPKPPPTPPDAPRAACGILPPPVTPAATEPLTVVFVACGCGGIAIRRARPSSRGNGPARNTGCGGRPQTIRPRWKPAAGSVAGSTGVCEAGFSPCGVSPVFVDDLDDIRSPTLRSVADRPSTDADKSMTLAVIDSPSPEYKSPISYSQPSGAANAKSASPRNSFGAPPLAQNAPAPAGVYLRSPYILTLG